MARPMNRRAALGALAAGSAMLVTYLWAQGNDQTGEKTPFAAVPETTD